MKNKFTGADCFDKHNELKSYYTKNKANLFFSAINEIKLKLHFKEFNV